MIVKNVEKKEKNVVTFQVEVTKEEFEDALSHAYHKNKKNISVPGFRKGKAPRLVIEGMYGANVFYEDAIEIITPKAFDFAVEQEKLTTVGRPSCNDAEVGDEKDLLLSFETALYPEVTLGQYKGLEVPKEEINIGEADVDTYLEEMRKRNGRQVSVDRPAKMGDTANIDFEGFKDGVAFAGGKGAGHKLELGEGQFIPGFEEGVVGMSAGEEKDIDLTFPEQYQSEELAGQAVVFKVKVNEVIETELPELDDEFAKDVSEFDTLEDYRTAIMEELVKKRTSAVEEDFSYAVIEEAVKNMEVEIPEAMLEERIAQIANEYDRSLMGQGMRLEEYLRMSGMDPESFTAMIRPQAEARIKGDLLLNAIVEAEDIQISEEELETGIANLAEAYKMTPEQIREAVPVEAMQEDMKKKKANDIVLESAIAVAPKAEDAEKEEKTEKPKKTKKAAKAEKAEETEKAEDDAK